MYTVQTTFSTEQRTENRVHIIQYTGFISEAGTRRISDGVTHLSWTPLRFQTNPALRLQEP